MSTTPPSSLRMIPESLSTSMRTQHNTSYVWKRLAASRRLPGLWPFRREDPTARRGRSRISDILNTAVREVVRQISGCPQHQGIRGDRLRGRLSRPRCVLAIDEYIIDNCDSLNKKVSFYRSLFCLQCSTPLPQSLCATLCGTRHRCFITAMHRHLDHPHVVDPLLLSIWVWSSRGFWTLRYNEREQQL